MLEYFFQSPTRLRQLRQGPLANHLDGLAAQLRTQGYAPSTATTILRVAGEFNRFVRWTGVCELSEIGERLSHRFLTEELAAQGTYRFAPSAMRHVLEYLREQGVNPQVAEAEEAPPDPIETILRRFDTYLRDVRGLAPSTCEVYRRGAQRFLIDHERRHGGLRFLKITGREILEYISDVLERYPGGRWRQQLCTHTRVFLRFLRSEGAVETELDRLIPQVPHWRLESVPRHLPWEQVRTVIDRIDASKPQGMRDKAILLTIATLGLRSQEVQKLQLDHIGWRSGEVRIAQSKSRRARVLPLSKELGDLLTRYLRFGRPRLDLPFVFLRHRAPQGPLRSSDAIGQIVRRHLRRAGIDAPNHGAHVLRHSLATRMVNRGVPIKEIADLLGHASINTTAIYTKVDTTRLAAVALPFPGEQG